MSHKYDQFFKLLREQRAAEARTIACATELGLPKIARNLEAVLAKTDRIANNVLTKIEAAAIERMMAQDAEKCARLKVCIEAARTTGDNPIADFSAPTKGTE